MKGIENMLDYEGIYYTVDYLENGCVLQKTEKFDTEEECIIFIKNNRNKWKEYRLIKHTYAIIDF